MNRGLAWLARQWRAALRRARPLLAVSPLTRTFFVRFFENDLTGGTSDLRSSFFWMIAFFGTPGALIPVIMSVNWEGAVIVGGTELLRVVSRADKVLYLGLAMISSGLISAGVWSSVLLDRRDSLVLGTLPLTGARIVRAKLTALAIYVALMAFGIHTASALTYGFILSTHNTFAFLLTGIAAHMTAACAAAAFVMFGVAAFQGLFFAALGPRWFFVVSTWLQSLVMAVAIVGLLALPTISGSTVDTLAGSGPDVRPWILYTPPLWFLGIYESVLGTSDENLHTLATIAVAALGSVCLVTFVSYPMAYRRLVATVVELPKMSGRQGWAARAVEAVVVAASRRGATRAASQFYTTAIRRSATHRLAMAVTVGVTAAVMAPTILEWAPRFATMPPSAPVSLLGLPLQAMFLLLVGLRVSASLPADLPSRWMLDSIGASPTKLRSGLWRSMFVAAVVPVALAVFVIYGRIWGMGVSPIHALLCVTVGATLVEMLLWGFDGMPCAKPWRPEHANLRKWWPAYLGLFALVGVGVPAIERMCFDEDTGFVALFATIVGVGLVLRVTHLRRRIIPDENVDEPPAVQILNLD